jgi:hypothetical protein
MYFDQGRGGRVPVFDMGDEAIAAAGQSLDVAGFIGRITQNVAQFSDGAVQPGVEIDKSIAGPEFLSKLLASNDVTGMLEQKRKYLERLVLKLEPDAVLVHLARTQVHVEGAKARPAGSVSSFHSRLSSVPAVYHQMLRADGRCAGFPCNSPEFRELDDQNKNICRPLFPK